MVSRYEDDSDDADESQPLMAGPERDSVDVNVVPVASAIDDDATAHSQPRARDGNRNSNPNRDQSGSPLTAAELEVDDSSPPIPRFIQDEGSWKRFRWVPFSVRRVARSTAVWARGPATPARHRIKPLFPAVQEFPLKLVDRFIPSSVVRFWLLAFAFSVWVSIFAILKWQGTLATEIRGWGEPQVIGCGVTYWTSGNNCGLDGFDCRPFNGTGFAFRCAANCRGYQALEPRAVGDQEVLYKPLVIGGGPGSDATYRGDSFICGSAIHAGVISDRDGGCGVVELMGRRHNYQSVNSNGIESVGFNSYFPLSYRFVSGIKCSATDTRWPLLALTAVFTGLLSLFTSSPGLFFFPCFGGIFWTVGLALDPPPSSSVAALVSNILGKFLPAMFCAWVMYDRMGVRRALKGLTAQIEKTILWLGACWVGAMNNYTLSFIPINRLNAHDLQQQPGARGALAIVIIVLLCIVVLQVWYFRQEGRLLKYLKLYAIFVAGILVCLALPGLNLRIHHYILALLLLPGTSLQTRPSLLYQGLLVGLFINGIARWGFDPVLQTSLALRGDAQKGSHLPVIKEPEILMSSSSSSSSNNNISTITFKWEDPLLPTYDGISVLVNDVERFRSYFEDEDARKEFAWTRSGDLGLPEYFRFAFMEGSTAADYTKAGIWTQDGTWSQMKAGPSRLKTRSIEERVQR